MNSQNETFHMREKVLGQPKKPICPECHGAMNEVERVQEGCFDYVWYKCAQTNCDGQWLEKNWSFRLGIAEPSPVYFAGDRIGISR